MSNQQTTASIPHPNTTLVMSNQPAPMKQKRKFGDLSIDGSALLKGEGSMTITKYLDRGGEWWTEDDWEGSGLPEWALKKKTVVRQPSFNKRPARGERNKSSSAAATTSSSPERLLANGDRRTNVGYDMRDTARSASSSVTAGQSSNLETLRDLFGYSKLADTNAGDYRAITLPDYSPDAIIGENKVGEYLFFFDRHPAHGAKYAEWGPMGIASRNLVSLWIELKVEVMDGGPTMHEVQRDEQSLVIRLKARYNAESDSFDTATGPKRFADNDAESHDQTMIDVYNGIPDHLNEGLDELFMVAGPAHGEIGDANAPVLAPRPSEKLSDDLINPDAHQDQVQAGGADRQVSAEPNNQALTSTMAADESRTGRRGRGANHANGHPATEELECNDPLLDGDVHDHGSPYACEDPNHTGQPATTCKQHHEAALAALNPSQLEALRQGAAYPLCEVCTAAVTSPNPRLIKNCTCLTKPQCTWCFWDELDKLVNRRRFAFDQGHFLYCIGCGNGVTGDEPLSKCLGCDGVKRRG